MEALTYITHQMIQYLGISSCSLSTCHLRSCCWALKACNRAHVRYMLKCFNTMVLQFVQREQIMCNETLISAGLMIIHGRALRALSMCVCVFFFSRDEQLNLWCWFKIHVTEHFATGICVSMAYNLIRDEGIMQKYWKNDTFYHFERSCVELSLAHIPMVR